MANHLRNSSLDEPMKDSFRKLGKRRNVGNKIIFSFSLKFSTLSEVEVKILATFDLLSANSFNLTILEFCRLVNRSPFHSKNRSNPFQNTNLYTVQN